MSNHKIDKLFKSKMEGYEVQPSPEAWAKLDAQLNNGNKKGLVWWSSIAASIIIVVAVTWMIIGNNPTDKDNSNIALQENAVDTHSKDEATTVIEKPVKEKEEVKEVAAEEPNNVAPKKDIVVAEKTTKEVTSKENKPVQILEPRSTDPEVKENAPEEKLEEAIETIDYDELVAQNNTEVEEVAEQKTVVPVDKSVKIIYTLPPVVKVDSSILQEKQKNSPFRKVVAFAKNITESEKGIGNLRDAKDNLLTFKKD